MPEENSVHEYYCRLEYWKKTEKGFLAMGKEEDWDICRVVHHSKNAWMEQEFTREEEKTKLPKLLLFLEIAFTAGKVVAKREIRQSLGLS